MKSSLIILAYHYYGLFVFSNDAIVSITNAYLGRSLVYLMHILFFVVTKIFLFNFFKCLRMVQVVLTIMLLVIMYFLTIGSF